MTVASTNSAVTARINDVQSFVTSQLSAATEFLDVMQEISNIQPPYMTASEVPFSPDAPDLGGDFDPSVSAGTIENAITALGAEANAIQDPNLANSFDDLAIDLPTQEEISEIATPSTDDFTYTDAAYQSDLLETLKTKLASDILDGTGLSPEVEDAIYLRDEERLLLAEQRAIDTAMGTFAARGFSMPAGVLNDAVGEIAEKSRMDRLTRSRDIMFKQADLAQKNVQAAIANGVNLENILIAHHDRVQDRALAAAKTVVDIGIAIMDAQVRRIAARIDLSKSEIDARVSIERFKLERYAAAVQVFVQKSQLALGKVKAYTDLFQVEAEVFRAKLQRLEAFARINLSQNEITLSNQQTNLKVALEAAKTNMLAFMETVKIKGGVSEAGARIYAGAVQSALNSINAVINLASSGITTAIE